jgi:hypothetical protein
MAAMQRPAEAIVPAAAKKRHHRKEGGRSGPKTCSRPRFPRNRSPEW